MNLDELKAWIDEAPGLRPHAAFLLGLAKPCVGVHISAEEGHGFESRVGGRPMVAPDFVWPTHLHGEYHFLGQFNFAELASPPAELPKTGLLTLFYNAWGPNTPDDVQVEHDVVAMFHTDLSTLTQYEGAMPDPWAVEPQGLTSRRITFRTGVDIPRDEDMRKEWPFDFDLLDERLEEF